MLFTTSEPPKMPPLIQYVIEQRIETPPQQQPTLAEKIETDINNCEPERYISAEDASCLPKPVKTPPKAVNTVKATVHGSNAPAGWYPYGQCTYWVWSQRNVGNWNNASEWAWQARRDGWTVSSTPIVGAIGQRGNHVVYVESVSGNNVTVSEMNYQGWGVVSRRTVSASYFTYIY
jgi:surface antigen